MAAENLEFRSHLARREQEEAMRRQDEARRGVQGPDRQALERYQDNLVRGEQGMQSMRREGGGERRPYGYEPRR